MAGSCARQYWTATEALTATHNNSIHNNNNNKNDNNDENNNDDNNNNNDDNNNKNNNNNNNKRYVNDAIIVHVKLKNGLKKHCVQMNIYNYSILFFDLMLTLVYIVI